MDPDAPSRARRWLALGAALLVVGTVYFWRLDAPLLWGDEAGTAVFARNVRRSGVPIAFDGRNLSIYDGGAELNDDLVAVKIPWVQYYVGALSLMLFGDDTRGIRSLFAVAGMAALLPLSSLLRTRVPCPRLVSVLLLLAPQTLLFNRSARYYSIVTLGFAILAWLVCGGERSRTTRIAAGSACFVGLFHTHPLAAAICGLTVLAFQALRRKGAAFCDYLVACAVGFSSWLVWFWSFGPTLVELPPWMDTFLSDPTARLRLAASDVVAAFLDLDAVNCFPTIGWAVLVGAVALARPRRLLELVREPLCGFVLLGIAVHVLVVATFIDEPGDKHVRYMPHLIAFAPIPLVCLVRSMVADARIFVPLCVALLATNALTVAYWTKPSDKAPLSWWPATYGEILRPRPEAWDAVIETVERRPRSPAFGEPTMLVTPPWMLEIAIFYLGDEVIGLPAIEPGSAAEGAVRRVAGDRALEQFRAEPTWVVVFHADGRLDAPGYERIEIPVYRLRPDDGTRPELTRHTFRQPRSLGAAYLYRRME